MNVSQLWKGGVVALAAILGGAAQAQTFHTYTFSGTGTNGVTAAGTFVIDDSGLTNGYFASGGIYPSFSLTISNISTGGGPATVTFDSSDSHSSSIVATWLTVVGSTIYVGPQGEYDYVSADRYWFPSTPTQPTSSFYQTVLNYNSTAVSTINWSAAVAVPEPATFSLLAGGLILGLAVRRRLAGA